MTLDDWITHTLNEFTGMADTLDYLKSIEEGEREELYRSFRELYNKEAIGILVQSDLDTFQWETFEEPYKVPEDFDEKLLEKAEKRPKPKIETTTKKEKGKFTLDDLMGLASSYLIEASKYAIAETEMRDITPKELIEAIRIIYARDENDEDSIIFLEEIGDRLYKFDDNLKYVSKGLHIFTDFSNYLRDRKEDPN